MRRSAAGWRFLSLKGGGWSKKGTELLGHEWITGQSQVRREYKYYAQNPWVLQMSLGEKFANLCSVRDHFGTIISMKIVHLKMPFPDYLSDVKHNGKIFN